MPRRTAPSYLCGMVFICPFRLTKKAAVKLKIKNQRKKMSSMLGKSIVACTPVASILARCGSRYALDWSVPNLQKPHQGRLLSSAQGPLTRIQETPSASVRTPEGDKVENIVQMSTGEAQHNTTSYELLIFLSFAAGAVREG